MRNSGALEGRPSRGGASSVNGGVLWNISIMHDGMFTCRGIGWFRDCRMIERVGSAAKCRE